MRDSRRARVLLVVLLLLAVTFVILDLRGGASGPRDAGNTVIGSAERAVSSVTRPIGNFFGSLSRINSNEERAQQLQDQNDQLQTQLRELKSDAARAAQVRSLLRTAGIGGLRIVPAQVISVGPTQGFAWTVTLDVGTRDGVRRDLTVISGLGLVGRVVSVGRSTCTVLLAIDPASSVGARVAASRQVGIVDGGGLDPMTFQLLNPLAPIREGDALLTFGSQRDRPYVPGIPIGTVTSVRGTAGSLSRVAEVKPFVDYTSLDVVGVVVGQPSRDPRDSLLPRSPTPAPTVTVTVTAPPATPGATPRPTPTPTRP